MNDEQELLASAYLDGALTDEERERAEADPEVMAAVEQLRELRRALSLVDPPNPARRDAAIKAALGLFDAERAPAAPARSRVGRRTNTWFIGAAAAALVLVVAGGILATRSDDRGGGDDSAGGAAVLPETTTQGRVLAGDAGGGAEATAGTTASPEARAPTTSAAGTFAVETVPAPQASRLLPVFTSPGELTDLAAQSRDDQLSTADAGAPSCNAGRWLGPAIYMLDGDNTRVDVYLSRRAGRVRAVDPSTCMVLVTAPAP